MAQVNAGKLLHVDLAMGRTWTEPMEEALLQKYLLGSGLAAYFFARVADPALDALAPESPIY
ncbi:MAG: aldehyde ferredoxin oxidoreductase N-terminal domain-containing protein, partial [Anaerolineae bacterium]